MSSSNRNVGRNASHHVPHEEFFGDDWRRRRNSTAQAEELSRAEELPSEMIEWTIHLNVIDFRYAELSTELRNRLNMELSPSDSDTDIVTVSGIPPDNDFGEHTLMEVVRTYAPNAKVIREQSQREERGG